MRVSRKTFEWIVIKHFKFAVENGFHTPGENAFVDFSMRMAIALQYLPEESGFQAIAALFGISKSTTIRGVNMIMDILVAMISSVIHFSATNDAWRAMSDEFEEIGVLPDVGGAVDGTIFRIDKPFEYDGWIFRKGFAAINMQAMVDAKRRFMEYSIRPGSCSDKNVWKLSSLGRFISTILPALIYLISDSTLLSVVLIPYEIFIKNPNCCGTFVWFAERSVADSKTNIEHKDAPKMWENHCVVYGFAQPNC